MKLISVVDTKPGVSEADYHDAYAAFVEHLIEAGLATGWVSLKHAPHDGYNSGAPDQKFMSEIHFSDAEQAQAAWDYIVANEAPVRALHGRVNAHVTNSWFALYTPTTGGTS